MSKIEVCTAVHGIAPRSDQLHLLGTDLEKGRINRTQFTERVADEAESWLDLQLESGITIIENGKLHWQDHLRPIVLATEGFIPGTDEQPVTRWFETNRFYRQPTIIDELVFDGQIFDEAVGPLGESLSLICPKTFSNLCKNTYGEMPTEENVLNLYRQIVAHCTQKGVQRITFENYTSTMDLFNSLSAIKLIEALYTEFPQVVFCDLTVRPGRYSIPLEGSLGVRVENDSLEHLRRNQISTIAPFIGFAIHPSLEYREVWQCPVSTDQLASDDIEVSSWPLEAIRHLGVSRLVLTNTVDFEEIPLIHAVEKVKRLGELGHELSEYLEENL